MNTVGLKKCCFLNSVSHAAFSEISRKLQNLHSSYFEYIKSNICLTYLCSYNMFLVYTFYILGLFVQGILWIPSVTFMALPRCIMYTCRDSRQRLGWGSMVQMGKAIKPHPSGPKFETVPRYLLLLFWVTSDMPAYKTKNFILPDKESFKI